MKFNGWSMKRLREGKKRLTSRTTRHVNDDSIEFVTEHPLPWWFIREFLYRDEGAESPEELQRVINQIFRRQVCKEELFFVHVLKPEFLDHMKKDA